MDNWQKEADNWALDRFDYIIDTYKCKDFIEYTGKIGGDTLTYRYYADGRISER